LRTNPGKKELPSMKTGPIRRVRRQVWSWMQRLLPQQKQKGVARYLPAAYLQGRGLEIGALADPLRVPARVQVQYVDRFSVEDLRRQYPTLNSMALVPVDVVSDGERLSAVDDETQDFVISRHFLEHCQDPIGTIEHFFRVLKPGGVVYFTVPDKRFTFDRERPVTPLSHLFEDHEKGPEGSRLDHFEEYVRCSEHPATPQQLHTRVKELMDRDYSIHYHVWSQHEMLELLLALRTKIGFEIESFCKNRHEIVCVLRKDASVKVASDATAARRAA
jgi:SAM-dependent methyltransferase